MHAVVVSVTINNFDDAVATLRGEIVPRVSQAPGFVGGYWVAINDRAQGRGTIVYESEDAARAVADQIQQAPTNNDVTIDSIEVGEVTAQA